jgi:hypothetical protein
MPRTGACAACALRSPQLGGIEPADEVKRLLSNLASGSAIDRLIATDDRSTCGTAIGFD